MFDVAQTLYRDSTDVAFAAASYNLQTAETGYVRVENLLAEAKSVDNENDRLGILITVMTMQVEETIQLRALIAADIKSRTAATYASRSYSLMNDPDAPPPQPQVPGTGSGELFTPGDIFQ